MKEAREEGEGKIEREGEEKFCAHKTGAAPGREEEDEVTGGGEAYPIVNVQYGDFPQPCFCSVKEPLVITLYFRSCCIISIQ